MQPSCFLATFVLSLGKIGPRGLLHMLNMTWQGWNSHMNVHFFSQPPLEANQRAAYKVHCSWLFSIGANTILWQSLNWWNMNQYVPRPLLQIFSISQLIMWPINVWKLYLRQYASFNGDISNWHVHIPLFSTFMIPIKIANPMSTISFAFHFTVLGVNFPIQLLEFWKTW